MTALVILFPVFCLLFLGFLSRKMKWITPEQNAGAKKIVFTVLFPFLVFNILFTADLHASFTAQFLVADGLWIALFLVGCLFFRKKEKFSRIAPFLLMTSEGGNVALPLYTAIVGSACAIHIVTFDVGGILINFGLVPAIVAKMTSGKIDLKSLLKKILLNPFMIAVILGLLLNRLGLYGLIEAGTAGVIYDETIKAVVTPVSGMILFTLGYELKVDRSMLKPILKTTILRLLGGLVIIFLLFHIFPDMAAREQYRIAVLIYFLCPTGFPMLLQVGPLYEDEKDKSFMSAFISLYLVITLIAYVVITFLAV